MLSSLLRAMTPNKQGQQGDPEETENEDLNEAEPKTEVADVWQTLDRELRLNIGNSLKCGICLSTLTNPKRTPCVHAFCQDCIVASLMSGNKKCPECNTPITKRSLQPFEYLQELTDTYKEALREFGLVPTLYNPNFTTMTQKVTSQNSQSEQETSPQGQLDRLDVATAWQQKALPVLAEQVPLLQKKENDQVVAANYKACKPFLVKKELPTTQDVQEQAREQQWADHDWKQKVEEEEEEEVTQDAPKETSSKRVSFSTKPPLPAPPPVATAALETEPTTAETITPRLTNVTTRIRTINRRKKPFDSALSPIQVQHSQTTGPSLSMPTPSPTANSDNNRPQEVTGMAEDSFGALHLLPTSATKLHNDEDDDDDDDKTQSMKSPDSSTTISSPFANSTPSANQTEMRLATPASTSSSTKEEAGDQKPAARPTTASRPETHVLEQLQQHQQHQDADMEDASNEKASSAVAVAESAAASTCPSSWKVGDIVNVQARTWPGVNKPGGVARVVNVFHGFVDVAYILGGKESQVDSIFIKAHDDQPNQRRRSREGASELPMSLLQALEEQGFDTTGNRPLKTPYKKRPRVMGTSLRDTTNHKNNQQKKGKQQSTKSNPPVTITPNRKLSYTKNQQKIALGSRTFSSEESVTKADAHYKKVLDNAKAAKEIHIVTSSLHPDDMAMLRTLCSKPVGNVKLCLSDAFGKKSTICILPVEQNDADVRPKVRTVKAMRSALAGIPIVSPDWISQVTSQEQVVIPSSFVRSLPTKAVPITAGGVARLAAAVDANDRLFGHDTYVFLCGNFPDGQRTDMHLLAKEAGAKVLKTPDQVLDKLKQQPSKRLVILCHNSNIAPASLEKQLRRSLEANPKSALVVSSSWLFDSIACAEALPPHTFAPPPLSRHRKATELWQLCCESSS
jgi:hypothetical protein